MWTMHVIIGSVLSQLQLYTASSTEDWLASSHANISNGLWHSVLVEKVVNTTILTVDGEVEAEATAPTILRTNSPLYIGGLPGEFLIMINTEEEPLGAQYNFFPVTLI